MGGHSSWVGGTQPAPRLYVCPSGWVTWLLGASASQPACGLTVAQTDQSFAQNSTESGVVEIPQNIRMGLTAAVSCRSVCKTQRADSQQSLGWARSGGWWSDRSRPQALPALALQAPARGARGLWVPLCPPGRLGGLGEEALVWLSPVQMLRSRVQWELLPCMWVSSPQQTWASTALLVSCTPSPDTQYTHCP